MFAAKVLILVLVVTGHYGSEISSTTTRTSPVTQNPPKLKIKHKTKPQWSQRSTAPTPGKKFWYSKDLFKNVTESIQELPGMILFGSGFLMGIVLTTLIVCITKACQRGKKKRSSYQLGDQEMNTQASTKVDGDAVQDEESAGQLLPNGDGAPKEAEYSDLDFSAAKNRKAPEVRTIGETEYAEIKIENQAENAEDWKYWRLTTKH
ncbi:hypothetical protein OJAV_G00162990 [Oryzias javanicus]|uniref:EVA1 domain-containing protein n=1 Tax=Oryzias javanicus TaxID=123683 RepID=A0A437CK04_ORYJA|nr:hypothetical protein OJAV_G00162990 [Oryzias javanicus]